MDSVAAKPISSTLHGATVQTAEGNEFINTGRDTINITQVIQNFIDRHGHTRAPESEQTFGGNIIEDNEDLQRFSAPESEQTSGRNIAEDIGKFDIYSAISTVLATIFGRRHIRPPSVVGDPICPDESNLLSQESNTDCALIHCLEPAATVSDILTPDDDLPFSSLPNTDTGRYTRSMLNSQRQAGYPLYEPRPDCDPSTEYWKKGVRIGDVGIVTEDGIFDFIFNVCPSQNPLINPSELPDDFEALERPEIRVMDRHFKMETHLFNNAVSRIEEPDVRYKCSGAEGAILELPSGATLFEAKNKRSFRALASRHAEDWYKYTIVTRGRDVPNGSLYLVTSCVKCTDWGIAVFDRPSASQDYLQFVEHEFQTTNRNLHSKYDWKGSGSFVAKVAMDSDIPDSRDGDGENQCIFLRGYKIMLRKDVWDNAIDPHSTVTSDLTTPSSSPNPGDKQTRQSDISNQNDHPGREDGGGSESAGGTSGRPAQNTYECGIKAIDVGTLLTTSSQLGAERVIIQADFNASPLNPSDIVNAALLSQEPNAKIALTHDDDWWNLLRDYGDFGKITSSYTSVIDEYGSASLEIVGDRSGSDSISSTLATRAQQVQQGTTHPGGIPNPMLPMIQPLEKGRFELAFKSFCNNKQIKIDQQLLTVINRPIDLHMLHTLVMVEGGEAKVQQKDLWSRIGGRMGFVQFPGTDSTEPSGPVIAQQLEHIYRQFLADFDRAYTANELDSRVRDGLAASLLNPSQLNMMVSMADQSIPQLKAQSLSEPMIQFIETHRSQFSGHNVEAHQQLIHPLPPHANPILPDKEQVQHAFTLVAKARQETMSNIYNRPSMNIPAEHRFKYNTLIEQLFLQAIEMDNKLAMLYIYTRREDFVRRLTDLVVSIQHQRNLLASSNPRFFVSLDNLQVMHQQMQQATETCSQLFAVLNQQKLQMQQQQQQIQLEPRPFNARNSFPLDTSQIRPPGASNPLLLFPSLQFPEPQQPTPPQISLHPSRVSPPPVRAESPAATTAPSSTSNAKRPREEDDTVVDADSIGNNASVANEPSPSKRVKTDWEIPQSEELKKKAVSGDPLVFCEAVTGRESAPFSSDDFCDYSQLNCQLDHEEWSIPDLVPSVSSVSSSSTYTSPESNTDGENFLPTMSFLPDIQNHDFRLKEIDSGESAYYPVELEWDDLMSNL